MKRSIPFEEEHPIFRESLSRFLEKEYVPHLEAWNEAGVMPREYGQRLGEQGYLCAWVDARVQTLYAGTTEVMKTIIAKRMGL